MGNINEIKEEIKEFFELTCIRDYIFNQADPRTLLQMKKKTPIGTWKIKSVQIGYFIDLKDNVIIGIISENKDEISQTVKQVLEEHAQKIE